MANFSLFSPDDSPLLLRALLISRLLIGSPEPKPVDGIGCFRVRRSKARADWPPVPLSRTCGAFNVPDVAVFSRESSVVLCFQMLRHFVG